MKIKHFDFIDIARGLGTFLVVFGHLLNDSGYTNKFIYSFHIPMFFITSGFIFYLKEETSVFDNIKSKFLRLIVPSIFFIIVGIVAQFITGGDLSLPMLKRITFWNGICLFNDPIWYFIVLFEVYLVYIIIYSLLKKRNKTLITLILGGIFIVLGYLVDRYKIFIPFGFNKALTALGFFSVGIIFREIYLYIKDKYYYKDLMPFLAKICLFAWFVATMINRRPSMYVNIYGKYYLFLISGVAGSFVFFYLCGFISKIKQSKIFKSISDMSVFVIGTHYVPIWYFKKAMNKFGLFGRRKIYLIISIVFTVVLLLIYAPICKFLDKKFPLVTGKYKRRVKKNETCNVS